MFTDCPGRRVKSRSRAAGKDDPFTKVGFAAHINTSWQTAPVVPGGRCPTGAAWPAENFADAITLFELDSTQSFL